MVCEKYLDTLLKPSRYFLQSIEILYLDSRGNEPKRPRNWTSIPGEFDLFLRAGRMFLNCAVGGCVWV